ncbi:hypothetical protein [Pseudomonas aeruginosa]|uniref:hypothetical protein n=1 Tax=Pseudomonas aeruginosa TaxID=287 RepID=UPI001E5ADE14|nr:hypothetical protein [Pseudomonas aeruginosa]MCC9289609.1 hypothetical protein [Pseudomonas aeruginosa]UVN18857.1 Hypothetical protein [Pseudomonas aeruginosa]
MKSFESCCQAFHAVDAAIVAHRNSELGVEIQEKSMLGKLSMYMELDNCPENPDLHGLTEADDKQLRECGVVNSKRLQDFHAEAEELRMERYNAVCRALRLLGEENGLQFNFYTSGALDERIANVLSHAVLLRKTLLDGLGYVDVHDPETNFAKRFYSTTKLKKTELFHVLKLCAEFRYNGVLLAYEVLARLGFDEGVDNDNR